MKSIPLISIILPVYNTSKFLQRCFNSIFNQTFKDFEVIAFDDGSTDDSLNTLHNIASEDARVKIFTQPNQGLSITRNNGILLAKAEIIYFMDSDDTIEATTLQVMYNLLTTSSDTEIAFMRCNYIDSENNITKVSKKLPENKQIYFQELIEGTLSPGAPLGLYYKKLFIDNDIFYPEYKFFEDASTTYKLVYFSKKICVHQDSLYNYYHNSNSISNTLSTKHIEDLINNLEDLKFFLLTNNIFDIYEESYQKRIVSLVNYICYKIAQNNCSKLKTIELVKSTLYILNKYNYLKYIHISKKILLYRNILMLLDDSIYPEVIAKYILLDTKYSLFLQKSLSSEYGLFFNVLQKLKKDNINQVYIYAAGALCQKIIPYIEEMEIKIIAVIDKNYKHVKCNYDVISIDYFYKIDTADTKIIILSEFYIQEIMNTVTFKGDVFYFYM